MPLVPVDADAMKRSRRRPKKSTSAASQGLQTAFYRDGEHRFSGFVLDGGDPRRKFTVEILVDGYPVRVCTGRLYVHDLVGQRIGDSCYGFSALLMTPR